VARRRPDAKLPVGLTSIKLYGDRIESMFGKGSIRGATARIDSRGYRGQKTYVTIEGPDIAVTAKLASNSGMARGLAQRFVAQVNSAAQRLEGQPQPARPTELTEQTPYGRSTRQAVPRLRRDHPCRCARL
jgi:hypothetical protein